jgi:hypothetical protein
MWAGESFGGREILGTALIVGAAVIEVMQRQGAVASGWDKP